MDVSHRCNEKFRNSVVNLAIWYCSIYVKFKNKQNESTVTGGRRVGLASTSWGGRQSLGRVQGSILHADNLCHV